MDNMRHLLSSFDPSAALHLGFCYEDPNNGQHFMSGGSGYVLTREAIRRFVEIGLAGNDSIRLKDDQTNNSTLISPCSIGHQGLEDVNLGIYYHRLID